MGCYIWYSDEGPERAAAPPRPSSLYQMQQPWAHASTASVPITVLLCDGPLLCGFNVAIKGLTLQMNHWPFVWHGHTLLYTWQLIVSYISSNWFMNFADAGAVLGWGRGKQRPSNVGRWSGSKICWDWMTGYWHRIDNHKRWRHQDPEAYRSYRRICVISSVVDASSTQAYVITFLSMVYFRICEKLNLSFYFLLS